MTNQVQSMTKSTAEWRKYDILIVDDDPSILEQIESDLVFEGFSLIKARSGEEALKIIEEQEIHIALCDQKMPGGIKGTDFLAQARKKQPHLIGIILSAFSEPSYLLSAINEANVSYYMLKPWDKNELIARLTQTLQLCHARLLEKQNHSSEERNYREQLLAQAIQEIGRSQASLREASQAFSAISEVAGQLSGILKKQLQDKSLPL